MKIRFLFLLILLLSKLSFAGIEPAYLSEQTLERFKLVPEFAFIIEEAEKLGVKVYLFGGTASAFAHYVRWDLEREAGDTKYQKERFDYDFTNIYRGNQDLDIVVDGTSAQADKLETVLQRVYPHFVGEKDAWEVRLLRQSRGDKQALLGDKDFKRQHSDTNSTGIIALNPDPGGIVYNDLLNWGSYDSEFLNDVASARIKFLYSSWHKLTQRYKRGLNPPVLAALRYLAKLAQYEVTGTEEDLKVIKQIIKRTDFSKLSDYGKKKAGEFALKTLLNAPDSEYAWNLLEKTGARRKLIEMDKKNLKELGSLSWWMSKEPLRSKDLGKMGKTARQIFGEDEIIVSHETNSFQAYENLTRSSTGGANAFISRNGFVGEAAIHGDGFYTRIGKEGARGTNLTIRFKLHPDAREGFDFKRSGDFIIVKNKKALTLIQENLNLSMIGFLKLVANSGISEKDKGLLEKFKRKFNRIPLVDEVIEKEFANFENELFVGQGLPKDMQFNYRTHILPLLPLAPGALPRERPLSTFSSLFKAYVKYIERVTPLLSNQEYVIQNKEFIFELLEIGMFVKDIIEKVLSQDYDWITFEMIEHLIEKGGFETELITHVLSKESWGLETDWIDLYLIMDDPNIDLLISKKVLTQEFAAQRPDWLEIIYKRRFEYIDNWAEIFSHEHWKNHPLLKEYVDKTFKKEKWEDSIIYSVTRPFSYQRYLSDIVQVLSGEHWIGDPYQIEVLEKLLKSRNIRRKTYAVREILSYNKWNKHPQGFELIMKFYNSDNRNELQGTKQAIFEHVFSNATWSSDPRVISLIEQEIQNGKIQIFRYMVRHFFNYQYWLTKKENIRLFNLFLDKLLSEPRKFRKEPHKEDNSDADRMQETEGFYSSLSSFILQEDHFLIHPQAFSIMKRLIIEGSDQIRESVIKTLSNITFRTLWMKHPKWLELVKLSIVYSSKKHYKLIEKLISTHKFQNHHEVRGLFSSAMGVELIKRVLIGVMKESGESALESKSFQCHQLLWSIL